MARQKADAP